MGGAPKAEIAIDEARVSALVNGRDDDPEHSAVGETTLRRLAEDL